jgi:hypothetical protein
MPDFIPVLAPVPKYQRQDSKPACRRLDNVLISADEAFANPGQYYVINYERKDKYDDAHIQPKIQNPMQLWIC